MGTKKFVKLKGSVEMTTNNVISRFSVVTKKEFLR